MAEEKKEILAGLYGLRAGLSLISENQEEIDKINDEITSCQSKIDAVQRRVNNEERKQQEINREINSKRSRIESEREGDARYFAQGELEAKRYAENVHFKPIFTWIAAAMLFAISLILFVEYISSNGDGEYLEVLISAFIPLLMAIALVIVSIVVPSKSYKDIYNSKMASPIEVHRRAMEKIHQLEQEIAKLQNEYEMSVKKRDEILTEQLMVSEAESAKIAEYSKPIDGILQNSKEINTALLKLYSTKVSPSDWENLDLVIYYLETGRADTVKEALQQVDRQKQTEQIVQAIHAATVAIVTTIRECTVLLGQTLVTCFKELIAQIHIEHTATRSTITTVAAEINSNLVEIKDATEKSSKDILKSNEDIKNKVDKLEKSLKNKSNVSSKKLVEDLNKQKSRW